MDYENPLFLSRAGSETLRNTWTNQKNQTTFIKFINFIIHYTLSPILWLLNAGDIHNWSSAAAKMSMAPPERPPKASWNPCNDHCIPSWHGTWAKITRKWLLFEEIIMAYLRCMGYLYDFICIHDLQIRIVIQTCTPSWRHEWCIRQIFWDSNFHHIRLVSSLGAPGPVVDLAAPKKMKATSSGQNSRGFLCDSTLGKTHLNCLIL